MADIYAQHNRAFTAVSAYVVVKGGERVATIAFKFPKDGASRLWVYVHWIGIEMVRGYAGGFGYDKQTAACANAAKSLCIDPRNAPDSHEMDANIAFIKALAHDGGERWDSALRQAGFEVWGAV